MATPQFGHSMKFWRQDTMQVQVVMPITITMEDPIVHSDDRPFCDDPNCPCQEEADRQAEEYERRCIEAGMCQCYDALPWRITTDYSLYY